MRPIQVIIADDHPVVRSGMCYVIATDTTISIRGEANNGEEALQLIEQHKPDVAVLDIEMPKLDGFQVIREMTRRRLRTRVVFLTMHSGPDLLYEAIDLGADGYLLKESALTEILRALHAVAGGDRFVSSVLTRHLLERRELSGRLARDQPSLELLTEAERRVLRAVANNKSSKEIADELCISYRTVENHRTNICQKLGVHGSNALLKFALQNRAAL